VYARRGSSSVSEEEKQRRKNKGGVTQLELPQKTQKKSLSTLMGRDLGWGYVERGKFKSYIYFNSFNSFHIFSCSLLNLFGICT
jgi:hypothetical protein